MIENIKKKLVHKYTAVITAMLLIVFSGCYYMYRQIITKSINDTLNDYLQEEVWEAQASLKMNQNELHIRQNDADINAMNHFTFWFLGDKLISSEESINQDLSQKLQQRMLSKHYQENTIYYENVKSNKVKWYFKMMMKNLYNTDGRIIGKVFVLANNTPMKRSSKQYIIFTLIIISALTGLAWLVGSYLAGRAVKQINIIFDKQKRFVSDASHELRTPLSVLLAYVELLEKQKIAPDITTEMKNEILGMSKLTSNLLELARSDNNRLHPEYQEFNLTAQTRKIIGNFQPVFEQKKLSVILDAPDELFINADGNLIKQLLYILIDNAVKYTPENKKIHLCLQQQKNKNIILIRDEGIGISETDQKHIFERFYRAEKSRSRNAGGLGLGLSLADIIVKEHKGLIEVKSAPEQGSCFTVTLPR
ncbi:MAG: HAMP domain-containing sensor histidine kinase [Alphaproteobacteria bacterium]|nr:HAMP domain-containing sensor histidine kinase [Alphaproteobacteria bacterium]